MKNSIFRERFSLTLEHKQTDRPQMDLASTDMTEIEGGPRRLSKLLGIDMAGCDPSDIDEAVLKALEVDIRGAGGILSAKESQARHVSPTEFVDPWGITFKFNGHHYEPVGRPLNGAALSDLEHYPWPDPEKIATEEIEKYMQRARYLYEETPYVVCGRHPVFGIMELGCGMFGYDDFLYRMAGEPLVVHRFFEIILGYQKRVIEKYYSALGPYLHFTTSGDDFGAQTGPFISSQMCRDLISPYMEERIKYTRQFTDAPFFHHSCGSIYPLIPELIRIGVKILNPIQPRAMDMEPEKLKKDFGDCLTFYGGIDTQELLRNSKPLDVYDATRNLIGILSNSGGYILSASHCIQEDIPLENVRAMYLSGTGKSNIL